MISAVSEGCPKGDQSVEARKRIEGGGAPASIYRGHDGFMPI